MTFSGACFDEDDLGSGRFSRVLSIKPKNFFRDGLWRPSNHNWVAGDATWGLKVEDAPMLVYWAAGKIRICPTREPLKYIEVGRPMHKPAGSWVNMPMAAPVQTGNVVKSTNANYDVWITMGGHTIDLYDIQLKAGWRPTNSQISFVVGLNGLRINQRQIVDVDSGAVVGSLAGAPMVYDASNPMDVRPISWSLDLAGGQRLIFTLPDLTGMTSPVIDPTFSVQPDATAGVDAFIRSSNSNTNYGTYIELIAGSNSAAGVDRFVGKFTGVATIPTNATVASAIESLYCESAYTSTPRNIGLYRILTDWNEAQVTWNIRKTSVNWGAAGGQSGIDYSASPTATTSVSVKNAWYTWDITADVAAWVSGVAVNYGNFAIGEEQTDVIRNKGFWSSDYIIDITLRPQLTVVYTLPGGIAPFSAPFQGAFG